MIPLSGFYCIGFCLTVLYNSLKNCLKPVLFSPDELEGYEALAIIEENPTNFGVWDRVLDPATAKVKVEQKIKSGLSSQQLIENKIKKSHGVFLFLFFGTFLQTS